MRTKYKVKHYFVLARQIRKDGTLTNRFSSEDCPTREWAEKQAKRWNDKGEYGGVKILPAQIIEYEAFQYKEMKFTKSGALVEGDSFLSIYSIPKVVKEAYNKNAGLA